MSLPTAGPGSRSDSRAAYGISSLLCPGTRVMKFYLIVAKGKHKGMPIEIKVDLFLIGAKKICQLHSNKPGVGEEHCALVTRERKVFLRDLNSGEATLINGSLVPPARLRSCSATNRSMRTWTRRLR